MSLYRISILDPVTHRKLGTVEVFSYYGLVTLTGKSPAELQAAADNTPRGWAVVNLPVDAVVEVIAESTPADKKKPKTHLTSKEEKGLVAFQVGKCPIDIRAALAKKGLLMWDPKEARYNFTSEGRRLARELERHDFLRPLEK